MLPLDGGGTWSRDDVILFGPLGASPLYRVSATGGGEAVPVTKLELSASRNFRAGGCHALRNRAHPVRGKGRKGQRAKSHVVVTAFWNSVYCPRMPGSKPLEVRN